MNTAYLNALAEPNRMRIVELLRDGPQPVGEIADRLRIRQPQASKHLRVLSEAGLVSFHPAAQQRIYQLQPRPFEELEGWLKTFRQIWDARLDALDAYMQELKEEQSRESAECLDSSTGRTSRNVRNKEP